jgi:hypothetical protein
MENNPQGVGKVNSYAVGPTMISASLIATTTLITTTSIRRPVHFRLLPLG